MVNCVYLPHSQLKWQRQLISGLAAVPDRLTQRLEAMTASPPAEAFSVTETLLEEDTVLLAEARTGADLSAFGRHWPNAASRPLADTGGRMLPARPLSQARPSCPSRRDAHLPGQLVVGQPETGPRPEPGRLRRPPACNADDLCTDLHRFAFLLWASDGEDLSGEPQS